MSDKTRCYYWDKCYRKNKEHLERYLHPSTPSRNTLSPNTLSPSTSSGPTSSSSTSSGPTLSPSTSGSPTSSHPTPCDSTSSATPTRPHTTRVSSKKPLEPRSRTAKRSDRNNSSYFRDTPVGLSILRTANKRAPSPTEGRGKKRPKTNKISITSDRWYFTRVTGHPSKFTDHVAVSFRDILQQDGPVKRSWQFSFIVDIDWLLEEYPEESREGPLFIFVGEKEAKTIRSTINQAKKSKVLSARYARVIVVPVALPIPFGTHHTKMMVLESEKGLRVVIHTANLVFDDWNTKTQGVWVSPLCPKSPSSGISEFYEYLTMYLKSYKLSATDMLCRVLSECDMSHVNQVRLVGSVPGSHSNRNYGYLRLHSLLSQHVNGDIVRPGWRIVANCSSIGTLGESKASWLDDFIDALQAVKTDGLSVSSDRRSLFQLLFPSVDMIRSSLEGYIGGGSVPYSLKVHLKQPWLRGCLCHWKSLEWGRSRVVPHIKTYSRISPDMRNIAWLLLTSANLSKAAWSTKSNAGKSMIRSYELGVLFLPPPGTNTFSPYDPVTARGMLLPYSLPPQSYSKTDKPWLWDVHYDELDAHGNKWPIDPP